MANEVTMRYQFQYNPTDANQKKFNIELQTKKVSSTGEAAKFTQSIPTSVTLIDVPDSVGTWGAIYIKNLDGTNFVQWGLSGQYCGRLRPGEFALLTATADLYALADTAACVIEVGVVEA